jgi:hypothetical protein
MELHMITPDLAELELQLANVAVRNAASAVNNKVSAVRARKLDQAAMNDLIELVNELVDDKNELIAIAQAYEQELVAQRIAEKDITYITTKLLPVVENLAGFADDTDATQTIDAIKGLVTVETLTIMQLVGFNFRRAIGEPLTTLVESLILSQIPAPKQTMELQTMQLRREAAYFEAIADPEARQLLMQGQATAPDVGSQE